MSAEASKKKPLYSQIWFWVVVVIVILVIGGVAKSNDGPQKVGESDGASSQMENSTENSNFKIGDIISVDGQEIVVLSAEHDYQTGSKYFAAKDGKEYVKINIQIKNKSQETKGYNALDWEIEDSNGDINSYTDAMLAQADDNLSSGSLAAGGTKKGSIVFEVPKGDAKLKIHYKPNIFYDKETVIEL